MRKVMIAMLAALTMLPLPALAAPVSVTGAWVRALPAHLPAAGYFVVHNAGGRAIAITGARSPACGTLMLHRSITGQGMDRMVDVAKVVIPAGGTARFSPGGYHLMCTNPTTAVRPGAKISVTLEFSDGAKLTAPFAVRNARGK